MNRRPTSLARSTLLALAFLGACATLPLLPLLAQAQDWKPVLNDPKKGVQDIPDVKKLKDKEWLNVGYTKYDGYKPRIAVIGTESKRIESREYENEYVRLLSSLANKPAEKGPDQLQSADASVRQALMGTGRFALVTRTETFGSARGEQDLAKEPDIIDKKTKVASGRMLGATYQIRASVVAADPNKESRQISLMAGGAGSTILGVGGLNMSKTVAWVRLEFELIHSASGLVIQSFFMDGTSQSKGAGLGMGIVKGLTRGAVGAGGLINTEVKASLSDALTAATNKAAYIIATKFEGIPYEGQVASVSAGKVNIDGGRNMGVKEGMKLSLSSKGECIPDPDDPNSCLGYDMTENGQLRVTKVADKYSVCEIADRGSLPIKMGDVVTHIVEK